jgi:hypothetical protein
MTGFQLSDWAKAPWTITTVGVGSDMACAPRAEGDGHEQRPPAAAPIASGHVPGRTRRDDPVPGA